MPQANASTPATPPPADAAQTVTLRYDDRIVGLTPLSIRAYNKAVEAIRAGQDIRLAIDGCGADADFSKDAPCGKRLDSLKRLLAKDDIRDTKRVLPELP